MNEMSPIAMVGENALATMATLTPAVAFAPGNIETLLEKIEREVRAVKTDMSTPKGRDAIKSLAYKVARSKTALDGMGKTLTDSIRKQAETIHAERRVIVSRLDALAEEVRRPLTEWEAKEAAKIAAHEEALRGIQAWGQPAEGETAAQIMERMESLAALPPREWDTFEQRAADAIDAASANLQLAYTAAQAREAEQAELARLRAAEQERERLAAIERQAERERQIAAEAAEKARLAAEQRAEQERQETLRIAAEQRAQQEREAQAAAARAEQERARIEAERVAAEQRAERAEQERNEAHERAERQAAETAARVERDRVQAAERAERERVAAVEDERRRVAAETAEREREDAKRAADKAHRGKINREAVAVLVTITGTEAGTDYVMTPELAKAVVTWIAMGKVPHVKIGY